MMVQVGPPTYPAPIQQILDGVMPENVLQAESITGFNSKDILWQEMKKTVQCKLLFEEKIA